MAFQKGNTFVFGETPSASKWDQLWRNDDALAEGTGFDPGAIGTDTLAQSAVTPEKRSGGFWLVNFQFADSTGNQSVTDVPFRPKEVQVFSRREAPGTYGYGGAVDHGSGIEQFAAAGADGHSSIASTTDAFLCVSTGNGAVIYRAAVSNFNSDGVTFNVTTTNSNSSVRNVTLLFRA